MQKLQGYADCQKWGLWFRESSVVFWVFGFGLNPTALNRIRPTPEVCSGSGFRVKGFGQGLSLEFCVYGLGSQSLSVYIYRHSHRRKGRRRCRRCCIQTLMLTQTCTYTYAYTYVDSHTHIYVCMYTCLNTYYVFAQYSRKVSNIIVALQEYRSTLVVLLVILQQFYSSSIVVLQHYHSSTIVALQSYIFVVSCTL